MELYKNIKQKRLELGMTQQELAEATGYSDKSMIAKIEKGDVDLSESKIVVFATALHTTPQWLMGWVQELETATAGQSVRINIYGSVPAGIPLEAIEDIVDWEEIPVSWTASGSEYFGLKVKGDSMAPKYLDGDNIILLKTDDCESGQDCVVYVNGYDATLKKVIKHPDHLILQPLNPSYDPIMYEYNDEDYPVIIAGVVVEIRRRV